MANVEKEELKMKDEYTVVPLHGCVFTMTGVFSRDRNEFVKIIRDNGGIYESKWSNKITHLLVGGKKAEGDKLSNAHYYHGIRIVTEEKFLRMIDREDKFENGINRFTSLEF